VAQDWSKFPPRVPGQGNLGRQLGLPRATQRDPRDDVNVIPMDVAPRGPAPAKILQPASIQQFDAGTKQLEKVFTFQGLAQAIAAALQVNLQGADAGSGFPGVGVFDPRRYVNVNPVQPFTVGTADQILLLQATRFRTLLVIVNTSTNVMRINFTAASGANSIPLNPASAAGQGGGVLFFDAIVPQNEVHGSGSAAATTGVLLYAEMP